MSISKCLSVFFGVIFPLVSVHAMEHSLKPESVLSTDSSCEPELISHISPFERKFILDMIYIVHYFSTNGFPKDVIKIIFLPLKEAIHGLNMGLTPQDVSLDEYTKRLDLLMKYRLTCNRDLIVFALLKSKSNLSLLCYDAAMKNDVENIVLLVEAIKTRSKGEYKYHSLTDAVFKDTNDFNLVGYVEIDLGKKTKKSKLDKLVKCVQQLWGVKAIFISQKV